MANVRMVHGKTTDLRDMLLSAGVGQYNAVLSIPYMNMLPRTCDPYAQGVIQLVQGLQNILNAQGARLAIDGGMGVATIRALIPYSGPRWYDKSWAQLYADVMNGKRWKGVERVTRGNDLELSLGSDAPLEYPLGGFVGDVLASPLPWIAAAAAGVLWWQHRKKGRAA